MSFGSELRRRVRAMLVVPAGTDRPRQTILVLLAFLAFVSLGLPDTLLGVAWPAMRVTFDLPLDSLGILTTCAVVGYFTSSFFAGGIIDRFGVAALLVGSCAIVVLSLLGYATSPVWPWLFLAALLAGLGAGAIDAGVNTFAAKAFSPRVLNWLHACWGVGATAGAATMAAWLEAGRGWRAGYATVAVLVAILTVVFFVTRRLWRIDGQSANDAVPATIGEALRNRVVRTQMAFYFVYCFLEMGAGNWLATLLSGSRGLSLPAAGTVVSVYWGALTLGRFAFGQAAAHFGTAAVLRVGFVGAIAGCAMLAPGLPRFVAIAGIALLGLSLAPLFPTIIALTPGRAGERLAARAVGMQVAAAGVGMAFGPALLGVLARRIGYEAIPPALIVVAILLPLLNHLASRRWTADERRPNHAGTVDRS